jgi:hypothetical protein
MVMFRYEEGPFEPGQYVRHVEARPDNDLDPVVEIVEDLGTIEVPCGKLDCRGDCLEYAVRSARGRSRSHGGYNLAECKIGPLVNIL